MCGRVVQSSGPVRLAIVDGLDVHDSRLTNLPRRFNGAPGQELLVIRQNHKTGERSLDPIRWGLIPSWCDDAKGGRKPINGRGEAIATTRTFCEAYRVRRCILPVDAFYEWRPPPGRQAYAIAMKDRSPFAIAGVWENWKSPGGEWIRTFAVITSQANTLLADIHHRMPVILHTRDYDRWLGDDPDPRDLLAPFPSEPMQFWPIGPRVNSYRNDDAELLTEVAVA